MKRQLVKRMAVGCMALVMVVSAVGCGSAGGTHSKESYADAKPTAANDAVGLYDDYDYAYEVAEEAAIEESGQGSSVQAEQVNDYGRKLIRTYRLTAETLNFQELISDVESRVIALGGYVESSNIGLRNSYREDSHYADYVIRIPKAQAPSFVQHLEESANITDKTENVEDVTLAYVDLDSHKEALQTEQKRLLEFLDKAESIEDIITIESRLSDVRYQIESMESQLRTYDNKIDYSTIYLNIHEVEKMTEPEKTTYGGKIIKGLKSNALAVWTLISNLVLFLITGIPVWIFLAVLILLVIWIVKLSKKRYAKNKQKRIEKQQQKWAKMQAENGQTPRYQGQPIVPVQQAQPLQQENPEPQAQPEQPVNPESQAQSVEQIEASEDKE